MTKGQLAKAYQVDISTFNRWLTKIKGLELDKGQRVLTPKQVEIIHAHLGNPD